MLTHCSLRELTLLRKSQPLSEPEPISVSRVTPPSPRKKARHTVSRRAAPKHRRAGSRIQASGSLSSAFAASRPPIPSEFSFGVSETTTTADSDVPEPGDKVMALNNRLAALIAEGQRALGKEVVVMSEDQDEPEDDGTEGWIEEDSTGGPVASSSTSSGFGSPRLPAYSPPFQDQPRWGFGGVQKAQHLRGPSEESFASASVPLMEDESMSPELRESMERARQMYQRRRLA